MTWIILVLFGVAIAAGGYYYFEKIGGERETTGPAPSPEWTTAPEGGVDVNLPQTPMTNVPATPAAPRQGDEGEGEAR